MSGCLRKNYAHARGLQQNCRPRDFYNDVAVRALRSSVKPKIEITEHAFKIALPNRNFIHTNFTIAETAGKYYARPYHSQPYASREKIVLSLFKDRETIGRKDIETALDVSQATAVLIVREMAGRGLLVKENAGKYQRYRRGTGF